MRILSCSAPWRGGAHAARRTMPRRSARPGLRCRKGSMIALRTTGNRCSRSRTWRGVPGPSRRARRRLALSGGDEETRGLGIELLGDIRGVFDKRSVHRISSEDLVLDLVGLEERPWAEYSGGKPVTKAKLARLLRPFGVVSRTIRLPDGKTVKGYLLRSVHRPLRQIPPYENVTTSQRRRGAGFRGF